MALQSAFTLTANEIYNTLANMIISQQVFADNLSKHQTLVDKARVDGGLYGDTKLYYATDVLKSVEWGCANGRAAEQTEATNLLALDRAEDPEVQAIKLDIFRQIRLTVDNYLTKRAFADEGTFASFNGVMLGWMQETKKVYDGTLYNVFIGTTETNVGKQIVNVELDKSATPSKSAGESIAKAMADLFTEMSDYTRDFNDYGYLRSYGDSEIKVIWNAKFFNQVKKIDLPSIFHDDALQSVFTGDVLPARYFGTVQKTKVAAAQNDGTYRSLKEMDVTVSTEVKHLFPGDLIPASIDIELDLDKDGQRTIPVAYKEDDTIICKVVTKLPPYMSAFETGTSFFNPRSLTENHYLTFGHNTLQYLKNYPFITVKAI